MEACGTRCVLEVTALAPCVRVCTRMLHLLYPGKTLSQLTENQRFTLDFVTDAACLRIIRFVDSRDPMDPAAIRPKVEHLIRGLSSATL